ncbi:ribonuclease H-like domain-containing protein [Crassisporium funariophilum]|nr:ribonuclease H-like domain-containing protein [Crassisporium funariophilum]
MADQSADNYLDKLQRDVLTAVLTPEDKLDELYGPATTTSSPVEVYTDGSCCDNGTARARAGAGVYWGANSPLNRAFRVPGEQSNNRGELFAILKAIEGARPNVFLKVYSDSVYAIKSTTEWVTTNNNLGWSYGNADIIKEIVAAIRKRTGPVDLIQVKVHSGNKHNDEADRLAKEGADLPRSDPMVPTNVCKQSHNECNTPKLARPKVMAVLLPPKEICL